MRILATVVWLAWTWYFYPGWVFCILLLPFVVYAWASKSGLFEPSIWLRRKHRKMLERYRGMYYEGPRPPLRIRDEILVFEHLHPCASNEQWKRFALQLARNCYRDGFVRGYEWLERDWDGPETEPEALLAMVEEAREQDEARPDIAMMLNVGYVPNDPLSHLEPEQRRAFLELLRGLSNSPYPVRYKEPE